MEFVKISDWLEIKYKEITDEMKEYTNEDNWIQGGFEYNGDFYWLSNFVRAHNNPWGEIDCPGFIHGYDATNIFRPLFVEISDSGDAVRLYKHILKEETV